MMGNTQGLSNVQQRQNDSNKRSKSNTYDSQTPTAAELPNNHTLMKIVDGENVFYLPNSPTNSKFELENGKEMEIDDSADLSSTHELSPDDANQSHNETFFLLLNDDIWLYLMTHFLGPKEVVRCSAVCKEFYRLASSEQIWRHMCYYEWSHLLPKVDLKFVVTWKAKYIKCHKEAMNQQRDRENKGFTTLHAAALGGHNRLVQRLITFHGDHVNKTAFNGTTPLYGAAFNGHEEVVKTLIHAHADVNWTESGMSSTPLLGAAFNGHLKIVSLLIKSNANINLANKNGATPLYIASQEGHTDVVVALIAAGANVNLANVNRVTPLSIAAQKGHSETVKALLTAKDVDINANRNDGSTPLFVAAQNGHFDTVVVLIAGGASVNASRHDGATALFMAAQNGHPSVVKLLLRSGADRTIKWKGKKTPLDIAVQQKHEEIVSLLSYAHQIPPKY